MKSKLPVLFAFALAATATLSLTSTAADKPGQPGSSAASTGSVSGGADLSLFHQLDANKDGVVDEKEAKKSAQVSADFKAIDVNGDGRISAEEWASFSKPK